MKTMTKQMTPWTEMPQTKETVKAWRKLWLGEWTRIGKMVAAGLR